MFESTELCTYEAIEANRPEGSLLNNNHTVCCTGQSVSLSVSHNFPSHHVHRRHVEKLCKLSGLNCTAQSERNAHPTKQLKRGLLRVHTSYIQILKFTLKPLFNGQVGRADIRLL